MRIFSYNIKTNYERVPGGPLCGVGVEVEVGVGVGVGPNRGVRRKFGHNLAKKGDTDVVEGLLEAYYEGKHKKMTKSQIWVIVGGWGQKLKIGNFWPKSV